MAARKERRGRRFKPRAGVVYRTADLRESTKNPTRMARRLEEQGKLTQLAHGIYAAPTRTRFGAAPPRPGAVMDAFLGRGKYVFTGPEHWNALGLGATALFPAQIVYNTERTGKFDFGGRHFILRRCRFPRRPTPEWYAVDLIQHRKMVGLDEATLERKLRAAVREGRLDGEKLRAAADTYGTKRTLRLVEEAIEAP